MIATNPAAMLAHRQSVENAMPKMTNTKATMVQIVVSVMSRPRGKKSPSIITLPRFHLPVLIDQRRAKGATLISYSLEHPLYAALAMSILSTMPVCLVQIVERVTTQAPGTLGAILIRIDSLMDTVEQVPHAAPAIRPP
jgi:hypothetical protein